MSISSEVRKSPIYSGNGVTTSFPFTFKVFSTADVLVVKSVGGIESTLTLNTDYTVSLNPNQDSTAGGSINLSTPLATGSLLAITSSVRAFQPVTLTGTFYPQVLNDALDRLTILAQQQAEGSSRSLRLPITSTENPDDMVAALVGGISETASNAAAAQAALVQAQQLVVQLGSAINPCADYAVAINAVSAYSAASHTYSSSSLAWMQCFGITITPTNLTLPYSISIYDGSIAPANIKYAAYNITGVYVDRIPFLIDSASTDLIFEVSNAGALVNDFSILMPATKYAVPAVQVI